jgi:hypothetical protein
VHPDHDGCDALHQPHPAFVHRGFVRVRADDVGELSSIGTALQLSPDDHPTAE